MSRHKCLGGGGGVLNTGRFLYSNVFKEDSTVQKLMRFGRKILRKMFLAVFR
jgi:hypothetical protein